jgi:hypothetical protein
MALKPTIQLTAVLQEMKERGFPVGHGDKKIHCELFKDNSGALTIASMPMVRPSTRHINIKYFHFLEHTSSEVSRYTFSKIDMLDQPAHMLTKPLASDAHQKHYLFVQGW